MLAVPPGSSVHAIQRWVGTRPPIIEQGEGDLGERLARTMARVLEEGASAVAVVGSDHPNLPLPMVAACLREARAGRVGWIPTRDGGFAALALSRPLPHLLQGVPWSTPGVAAALRRNARRLGVRLVTRGEWYDVDTAGDLARLCRDIERHGGCPATRSVLAGLIPRLPQREGFPTRKRGDG